MSTGKIIGLVVIVVGVFLAIFGFSEVLKYAGRRVGGYRIDTSEHLLQAFLGIALVFTGSFVYKKAK